MCIRDSENRPTRSGSGDEPRALGVKAEKQSGTSLPGDARGVRDESARRIARRGEPNVLPLRRKSRRGRVTATCARQWKRRGPSVARKGDTKEARRGGHDFERRGDATHAAFTRRFHEMVSASIKTTLALYIARRRRGLRSARAARFASQFIFFDTHQISTSGSVVKSSSAVNVPDTIVTSRSLSSPSNTSTAMIPADNGIWSST